jgi:hypothetical protein
MKQIIKLCLEAIILSLPILVGYALNVFVLHQGYSSTSLYMYQQQATVSYNTLPAIMFVSIAVEVVMLLGWVVLSFPSTPNTIKAQVKREKVYER